MAKVHDNDYSANHRSNGKRLNFASFGLVVKAKVCPRSWHYSQGCQA